MKKELNRVVFRDSKIPWGSSLLAASYHAVVDPLHISNPFNHTAIKPYNHSTINQSQIPMDTPMIYNLSDRQ